MDLTEAKSWYLMVVGNFDYYQCFVDIANGVFASFFAPLSPPFVFFLTS